MKLDQAVEGSNYLLEKVGGTKNFQERAVSIGLVAETPIKVIRNQKKMPLLIYARDTLLAVNRKDAGMTEVKAL